MPHNAQQGARGSLLFIRISSLLFLLVSLAYLGLGALSVTALGKAGDQAARDSLMLFAVFCFVLGAVLLVTAVLGLRTAHNRFHVKPYRACIAVVAVVLAAGELLTDYQGISRVLVGEGFTTLTIGFCILAVCSLVASSSVLAYNKRHPEGEKDVPAPEYVPDSMGASATASDGGSLQLRISSKLGSLLHNKIDVLDAHDNAIFRVHSKAVSMTDQTFIEDAAGNEVAVIKAKLVSIHGTYEVEMADGTSFELSQELFRLRDVVRIDALGWTLRGKNVLGFDFDICDARGSVIARAHREALSLRDTYVVDVLDRSDADEVAAIFVVMKHIIERRQKQAQNAAQSAASGK